MSLVDANTYTERFTFNFTAPKLVIPTSSLTPDQKTTATCWYNTTVFRATLWTRIRAGYPLGIADVPEPINASSTFSPWPYRVDVAQTQAPGAGTPDCRDIDGRPIVIVPDVKGGQQAPAGNCACVYSNYRLGNYSAAVRSRRRKT